MQIRYCPTPWSSRRIGRNYPLFSRTDVRTTDASESGRPASRRRGPERSLAGMLSSSHRAQCCPSGRPRVRPKVLSMINFCSILPSYRGGRPQLFTNISNAALEVISCEVVRGRRLNFLRAEVRAEAFGCCNGRPRRARRPDVQGSGDTEQQCIQ